MAGCAFEEGGAGEVTRVEGGFGGEFGGGWHFGGEEVEKEGGGAEGDDGGEFEDCGGGEGGGSSCGECWLGLGGFGMRLGSLLLYIGLGFGW